ncbi:MAG TPA: peptidase M23 [Methylophilaceae bacterium]|nr:peptidase M23 [Methylophilaceae bacterium]HAJ71567.1 peptidase M23 [Methylophilaceae bacterium]
MLQKLLLLFLSLYLAGCAENPPAPVVNSSPSTHKPAPLAVANNNENQPSSYIVKKGDTLYALGLEFGYDYKEIAAANNLQPPYGIKVGQKLILPNANPNEKSVPSTTTGATPTDNGVVVTAIKTEPVLAETKPSAVTPVLTQPKAIREPYSTEAMNASALAETSKTEAKPTEAEVVSTKPSEIKPTDDDSITWTWPTNGKVTSSFNEVSNKGIDIAGTTGQAINAVSGGKVIYTGADLRGYGKLVIIKHNKTYLSVYAHNSKILVKEGQVVTGGQKIAEMGNTDTNTVKLHFEIRRKGKSVDPAQYLTQN